MNKLKFLPKLSDQHPSTPGTDWSAHNAGLGVLEEFANSLIIQAEDTPAARIKSVPSPWARPLLFDYALNNNKHPSHKEILNEWRGLLGCIALSRHLELDLDVQSISLNEDNGVMGALVQLAPDSKWTEIGLIRIRGKVIGGLSPLTIVFTGIRAIDGGVPFARDGRLVDPVQHYFQLQDWVSLALMAEWIDEVRTRLSKEAGRPLKDYLRSDTELLDRLKDWSSEAREAYARLKTPGEATSFVKGFEPAKLDVHGPQHPSAGLSIIPIVIPSGDLPTNDLKLTPLLTVDPAEGIILKDGTPYTGLLRLPKGRSQSVKNGRLTTPLPPNVLSPSVSPGRHFEAKLIKVIGARSGGGALVDGDNDESGGFLYPFRADLLEALGQDLVRDSTTLAKTGHQYSVAIELKLAAGFAVRFEHEYDRAQIRSNVLTPAVAAWPDFDAPDWQHHFYVIDHLMPDPTGLELSPWNQEMKTFESPDGRYVWGRSKRRVEAWRGKAGDDAGFLVPSRPVGRVEDAVTRNWDVAIDFGSTHTRVFYSSQDMQDASNSLPLKIRPRATILLGEDAWDPSRFFFPTKERAVSDGYEELQSLLRFPLDRHPGADGDWLPAMGLIFFSKFDGGGLPKGLRSHLKWHDPGTEDQKAFRSYLTQLLLLVEADARAEGAKVAKVAVAHPSAFNQSLFQRHRQVWGDIVPRGSLREPMTESTALANFLHAEGFAAAAVNLSAVDIGGSTSDIALWTNGEKVGGESIRWAGEMISRLVATDSEVRDSVSRAMSSTHFDDAHLELDWEKGEDGTAANELLYNGFLRSIAAAKGTAASIAPNLSQNEDDAGARLLFHISYLFAALSYLMGLFRRNEEDRPSLYYVHLGGHGSDYFPWLNTLEEGAGKSIVTSFFLAGAGIEMDGAAPEVDVATSQDRAKHEVGLGLLHREYGDKGALDGQRTSIVGETGFTSPSGTEIDPFKKVNAGTLRETIAKPTTPVALDSRELLNGFVDAFDATALTRRIGRGLSLTRGALDTRLRDAIHARLYDPGSAWARGEDAVIFEPVIVTEMKVLLEQITGNPELFFPR